MSDTFMRQWHMLRLIPRMPSKVSTSDLVHSLADEGFSVTRRTLQRDLAKLAVIYPLVCDERDKPFGWSWSADAAFLDIPSMDSHTALTFWLANQHLKPLLPKTTLKKLQPHIHAAEAVLNKIGTNQGAPAWRNKVRVLDQGFSLKEALIDSDVQNNVYDGLLRNRKLSVNYTPRSGVQKNYDIHPLGLILKAGISYLVCSIREYSDIRLLALHRISQAIILDIPSNTPDGFDLDDYIESGEVGFKRNGEITFKALFTKAAALHLRERVMSDNQTIVDQADGRVLLTATIQNTSDLHWWLRGFGSQVEVLEPECLRDEMIKNIKDTCKGYSIK